MSLKQLAFASQPRMTEAELSRSDQDLLDKLSLVSAGKLNRAGVLLFSHFPEKWVAR